jgi:gliding motility-associated-like protein
MTSAPTFVDATCGNCDGTVTMNPSGGSTPYTYSWTGGNAAGQTTQTATGLCAGTYIGTAVDASGCLQVSDTITIVELACACAFTSISVAVGPCLANSTYDITGTLDFTGQPTTGTLTITNVCSGNDTTINAPFVSPLNWSLSGLPTGTGTCDVTAVFSADPTCTISLGPANEYPVVAPCGCVANIGTFNTTITPNNGQNPYQLCFGDQFTITSNGDNIDPGLANNPPGPAYNPGIGYLIYSCPPTIATTPSNVFPNDNITNDPCFVGLVGFGNSFNDVNNLGSPSYAGAWTNNTIYYVPITFYDTVSGTYSYVNTNMPCYSMGQPYAVQYLTDITTVAVPDCQDSSVTITVTGGLPEADGSLYTASNLLPANASFVNNTCTHGGTIVINGLQNGDMYSFDIVDANGCPSTVTGGPFVGLPNANAGVDDTSCTLTYNLNAIVSFGTGAWTGPAGVVFVPANSANATVTVPAAGVYNFTWTEDNGGGCTSSDVVSITFNLLSIPNTPTNPLCNGGADGQIILAPQGGVPPYSYQWDAAAGNQTTNPAINLGAGTYMVTVTDAYGCFLDSTYTLTEPAPFTYTTGSTNANCGAPDGSATVVGFAGGTPGYTYDWGAGPVASNTLTNLTPGPYTVTVADANGCDTTFSITVGNNSPFTALITGSTNASCNGVADGTATADGNPAAAFTYQWDAAAGNQVTQTATGLGAGTYTVTVTDPATGCTDDTTVTITEPPALTVNAGTDVTICTGGNTNLSANGAGGAPGYTYTWDNGLGAGQNHNVSPAVQTTYIVTVTDANQCTAVDAIIVSVSPPLLVTASPDDSICPGGQANISALATAGSGNGGPYTYTWDNGLGAGQNQSVSPTVTTTYIVTVSDGCTTPNATDSVTIYIKPVPVVDFLVDIFSACESPQETFTFFNTTTPAGGTLSWSFGDGTGGGNDTMPHVFTGAGSYDISLTVTGVNGCTASVTKPNYVTVHANPTADFTSNPNPASMFDPTINFFDQSFSNIVSWAWDIGGLDSSIIQNPTYLFPEDTGNYVVTLTVVDVNGCTATVSNVATVLGEFGIYVPNAFTPDGDGINDGFFPNGFGITQDDYTFMIFDRWGEIIYESHKTFEPWDGTYKGKLVQNGVYVWKLKFKDINGKSHNRIGRVTIVR